MKISWQWLTDFFPEGIPCSPKEGADILTAQGLEVEGIEEVGGVDPLIVVGHVIEKKPHPGADRLSLCQVSTGARTFAVVCGAPNVKAGGSYPFAQLGATLPGGMVMKPAKIRGEVSEGMLCSEKELGLPLSEEGLLTLPSESPHGAAVRDLPGIADTILDVNVTPNRGDCLSHLGIARELAAHFSTLDRRLLNKEISSLTTDQSWQPIRPHLDAAARASCPLYSGRAVDGVGVGPSPFYVRRRLLVCGIRPQNMIIDATNYVLLERGHPTHAFDLSRLKGDVINIRHACSEEPIKTLDGQSYPLSSDDLVIADGSGAVALAGVMGGEESKVSETTTQIFLECAVFDPRSVRKTAKRLGLLTESSYRFERGVDPEQASQVMERVTALLQDWSGATLKIGPVVTETAGGKTSAVEIVASHPRLENYLGVSLAPDLVLSTLSALGFKPVRSGDAYRLTVPSWRSDIEGEADIAEEVARLWGYDQIPSHLPESVPQTQVLSPAYRMSKRIRSFLEAQGFTQTIHMSFDAKPELPSADAVSLLNPLSEKEAILRPSLTDQLLDTHGHYERSLVEEYRVFEIGNVFSSTLKDHAPYHFQELRLALLWSPAKGQTSVDFFDLKAVGDGLLQQLGLSPQDIDWQPISQPQSRLHPGRAAVICVKGQEVGVAGELHPLVSESRKLSRRPLMMDFNLDMLFSLLSQERHYTPISMFPGTSRDLSVVVPESISYGELMHFFSEAKKSTPFLQSIDFVALYRGAPLPADKKSMSFRLNYGSLERTLTDEEVNAIYFALIEKIKHEKGVEIR